MERYNIPTAKHGTFTKDNIDQSDAFLESMNPPYVLKADGLAAGKGVLIIDNLQNAKDELRSMILDKKFGDAEISNKHCNFFINSKNAKFDDMKKLINYVKKQVKIKTGVILETEIEIIE